MYKDVWKRFGAKILIVLCSVLLVGGVAIAAPRLRAAGTNKVTFAEIKASGATIELNGVAEYNYGADVEPPSINVISGGSIVMTLNLDTDYEVAGSTGLINGVTDSAQVELSPKDSTKIDAYLSDGTPDKTILDLTYKISKRKLQPTNVEAEFTQTYSYDNMPRNGGWVVTGLPTAFNSDDWTIKVKEGVHDVTLVGGTDYTIADGDAVNVGSYGKPITFTNFDVAKNVSTTVYMHVSALSYSENTQGELEVKQGTTSLDKDVHYSASKDVSTGNWTITGIHDGVSGAYYVGTTTYSSGSVNPSNYKLKYSDLKDPIDFSSSEQNHDYKQKPDSVWIEDTLTGNQIAILSEGNGYSTNYEVWDSERKEQLTGATAGRVKLIITAKAPYNSSATIWYGLRRPLIEGEMEWELKPLSTADKIGNIVYDGKSHGVKPEIYFKDSSGHILKENRDYTLSYRLAASGKVIETTDPEDLKDAGTVTITITGKAGKDKDELPNAAGYYGTLSGSSWPEVKGLSYEIKPLDLALNRYSIELRNEYEVPNSLFDVTCSKQEVLERVRLISSGNYPFKLSDITDNIMSTNEYDVVFKFNGKEIEDDDWGNLTPGEYTMEFDFHGNLTGKLSQTFTVDEYDEKDITVEYTDCSEGDGKDHVYTTAQHRPVVTAVKYKGNNIDLDNCKIEYGENINAGKNAGTILVTVPGNVTKTVRFDIAKRKLEQANIALPNTDFPNGTHEYAGKGKAPSLEKLEYNYTTGSGTQKTMTLLKDRDYTVEPNILYDANGNQLTAIDMGKTSYYYKIVPIGSCTVKQNGDTYVLAGSFTFTPRSIAPSYITWSVDTPMEYNASDSNAQFIKFLGTDGHLTVTDTEFGDTLIYDTDYTITDIDDKRDANGTVIFSIEGKGCYDNKKEKLVLNVGQDIVKAQMQEKNQATVYFDHGTREAWLTLNDYRQVSTGVFNVDFAVDDKDLLNTIRLRYPDATAGYNAIYKDKEYMTDPDPAVYTQGTGPTAQRYGIVKLTGKSGYFGDVNVKFKVQSVDLANEGYEIVILNENSYIYNGDEIIPVIEVVKKDATGNVIEKLNEKDYEVKVTNNINATTDFTLDSQKALVTVTGAYGFKGELRKTFEIQKLPLGVQKDYVNSDGTTHTYQAMAGGFSLEGLKLSPNAYEYTHQTVLSTGEKKSGVYPEVKVQFNNGKRVITLNDPSGELQCEYDCFNNGAICDSKTDFDKRAYIRVQPTTQNHNLAGEFWVFFDIKAVDLEDPDKCYVEVKPKTMQFAGDPKDHKPDVTVYQIKENGQHDVIPNTEYDVTWESIDWVSGSDPSNGFIDTRVVVSGKKDGKGQYNGNYIGSIPKSFVIQGDLNPSPTSVGYGVSETEIKPKPIPYSAGTIQYNGVEVLFKQRSKSSAGSPVLYPKQHVLQWDTDYIVRCDSEKVGVHDAIVEGIGNYWNWQETQIVIQGDLGDESYTECKLNSGSDTIAYVPGQEIILQKLISIVCGGKSLTYGKDYEFQDPPTAHLGDNKVVIVPTAEAKKAGYLKGELTFKYKVKSGLESDAVIGNIEKEYDYEHGEPVIDPTTITVTVSGGALTLRYQEDYDVEIDDAINVGRHKVTIIGKGNYVGTKTQEFVINPYNLANGWARKDVKVAYNNTVTYTGSTVYPKIESVTVKKKSGGIATLTVGDNETAANYEIRSGSTGDHVNWTDTQSGDAIPNFLISGLGNYTGDISFDYLIERKNIKEEDVIFASIEPQSYKNGKDVKPIPTATYFGKDLSGLEYSGNADEYVNWKDYTKDFTWQHLDIDGGKDLKSVGQKKIKIRGIGNFIGETELAYTVIPLDLSLAELTYTYDTPIYNGQPQQPAFKLMYDGDVILEYTGEKAVSTFIKNPVVTFENNINATKTAVLRVSVADEANDNYTGIKEVTFIILPASLTNHTKFSYRPAGTEGSVDLSTYKLNLDFIQGQTRQPKYATSATLNEEEVGIFFDDVKSANHGTFLVNDQDYDISYMYVEPDTDDVEIREEYRNPTPPFSYAGKVKVTITGKNNYVDNASYWYYIGTDISADAKISISPTTTVFNSQSQPPQVTITGVDKNICHIAEYRNEVALENLIKDRKKDFINAGTYYIRVEGDPTKGTYSTKPETLTYTITPRAFSNSLVIDGFKREYSYTGYDICPVGISVTDYIDKIKYKLTEDVDYILTYTNNLNAGTAYINIKGQNNFSGTASANFLITSSTISSGGSNGWNSFLDQGTGEISGSTAVSPNDVNMSMDSIDAMYYTGKPLYPKISISGMTENIDYTVTFSNNVEVGTAVATINGIGNNTGTITKNFRIIAQLSKCTISPIPAQQYTGSEVKPSLTVKCGNSILMEGTDYTVTYSNNINIGTATATLRALNNANYTGTTSVKFSIGNDVGGFIISGYAPTYAYTGKAITPGVVVETGSRTLTPGTEYTVSYSNNVNAGTATITVTGVGKYSGKQTANFIIEPKSIQSCDTTDVKDRTYTGDAYTPDVTVSDGGKVLTKGVDYTVTYTNNTNPGMASILIQGTSSNYSGTKIISFKISAVAVKGLKATNVKYNSLKLKWTKQGYADGYQVCDSKSKVIKTVKTNSLTITGLTAGKTYKYKVRSYIRNADGTKSYGAFSSVLNATTKLRTPTVKVVSNAKGQARISWSKVSGASGYEIYYKKSSGAKYKKLKTVNNPNIRVCTVRGMKSGDRAYFRIRAFRKNGSKKVYSSLNPLKVITVK